MSIPAILAPGLFRFPAPSRLVKADLKTYRDRLSCYLDMADVIEELSFPVTQDFKDLILEDVPNNPFNQRKDWVQPFFLMLSRRGVNLVQQNENVEMQAHPDDSSLEDEMLHMAYKELIHAEMHEIGSEQKAFLLRGPQYAGQKTNLECACRCEEGGKKLELVTAINAKSLIARYSELEVDVCRNRIALEMIICRSSNEKKNYKISSQGDHHTTFGNQVKSIESLPQLDRQFFRRLFDTGVISSIVLTEFKGKKTIGGPMIKISEGHRHAERIGDVCSGRYIPGESKFGPQEVDIVLKEGLGIYFQKAFHRGLDGAVMDDLEARAGKFRRNDILLHCEKIDAIYL